MTRKIQLINLLLMLFFYSAAQTPWRQQIWRGPTQGTTYHIIVYVNNEIPTLTNIKMGIDSILFTIDSSLSHYNPNALLSRFNSSSRGIEMDEHFKQVLTACARVHDESKGLFDPTILPLIHFWQQQPTRSLTKAEKRVLAFKRSAIGFNRLEIVGDSLVKLKEGVTLDFDGIAQGYTVDCVASYLSDLGIENYMVEIGGEITIKGIKQIEQTPFNVRMEAIAPLESELHTFFIRFNNGGITTSSIKSTGAQGSRYQHINPLTGYPSKSSIQSVTLYAPNCMWADAYDNVIMQLQPKAAIRFLQKHPFLAATFTYQKKGKVKIFMTDYFKSLVVSPTGKG